MPFAAAMALVPIVIMGLYLYAARALGAFEALYEEATRHGIQGLRIALRVWVALVLLFLFVPLALIVLYAFNKSNIESWPIPGLTRNWFGGRLERLPGSRSASGSR